LLWTLVTPSVTPSEWCRVLSCAKMGHDENAIDMNIIIDKHLIV